MSEACSSYPHGMGCDKRYGWQYVVGAHLFYVFREDANEADLAVILEELGLFLSHHQQVGHLCWDHNTHTRTEESLFKFTTQNMSICYLITDKALFRSQNHILLLPDVCVLACVTCDI